MRSIEKPYDNKGYNNVSKCGKTPLKHYICKLFRIIPNNDTGLGDSKK